MRALAAALVVAAGLAACEGPRRGEPLVGAVPSDDLAVVRGRAVFMRECYQCHPGGEAGVGPALNDRPWPDFIKRREIRRGAGAMPAFSRAALSEAQLADLLAYLRALRHYHEDRRADLRRLTRMEER